MPDFAAHGFCSESVCAIAKLLDNLTRHGEAMDVRVQTGGI